jgi:hypothetical protein
VSVDVGTGTVLDGFGRDGVTKATTWLGGLTAVGFAAAGIGGAIAGATGGDGTDLAVWLLLLLGGSALVLAGVRMLASRPWGAVASFAIGGLLGSLALFWSVIAPVIAIVLVVLAVIGARRDTA